jgi:uncharacterized protein YqgC (DUF456 family)
MITLIVIGIAGTMLPALSGVILVFGGIALAAWIDDFARIPVWPLVLLGVLTSMAWRVDYVAAVVGAKRAGASRQAIIGAGIGAVAEIFSGLWGLLFMPLVSAAIGECLAQRDVRRAGKVGIPTWIRLAPRPRLRLCSQWLGYSCSPCWSSPPSGYDRSCRTAALTTARSRP